jgi:hypothetical protein
MAKNAHAIARNLAIELGETQISIYEHSNNHRHQYH